MLRIRTDLAEELRDDAMTKRAESEKGELDGVLFHEEISGTLRTTEIEIFNSLGENHMGRPKGHYVTLSFPTAANMGYEELLTLSDHLAATLSRLCGEKKRILVAGLGNGRFAADALGTIAVRHILVTHHLKEMGVEGLRDFADIAAITPGIMAKTGMESADMVKYAAKSVGAEAVVVIDAMAAREAARLARTVQLSDTGLLPGSGLGNHRKAINRETVGVPVIAVGVPTVVDTATLVMDALGDREAHEESIKKLEGLFVSPKEIDMIAENLGRAVGYGVNRAFHGALPYEEMAMMA